MWFDFGAPRLSTLRWADLKKQLGHLKFDKVLQYVKLPRLFLDNEPKPNQDVPYQGERIWSSSSSGSRARASNALSEWVLMTASVHDTATKR